VSSGAKDAAAAGADYRGCAVAERSVFLATVFLAARVPVGRGSCQPWFVAAVPPPAARCAFTQAR